MPLKMNRLLWFMTLRRKGKFIAIFTNSCTLLTKQGHTINKISKSVNQILLH